MLNNSIFITLTKEFIRQSYSIFIYLDNHFEEIFVRITKYCR